MLFERSTAWGHSRYYFKNNQFVAKKEQSGRFSHKQHGKHYFHTSSSKKQQTNEKED